MAKSTIQKVDPTLLQGFAEDQAKAAAELQGGNRFSPPYIRVAEIKEKGQARGVVEVVNPADRDEKNNAKATRFDSLDVVLMQHVMTRAVKYSGPDGKMHTELFSVGPKRGSVSVGRIANGLAYTEDLEAQFPDGWTRQVVEYGTNQVVTKQVKADSRYFVVVALPEEAREAAGGSPLAMMFLSMTSTYGVMIKKADEAADRDFTLLSYPDKQDPEGHKGVLHQLLTREWELGTAAGLESKGTPHNAIWLTVKGMRLGDVNVSVPGFEIAREASGEELAEIATLKAPSLQMMADMLAQNFKDAWPNFAPTRLPALSEAAASGDWQNYEQLALASVPINASDDEPADEDTVDTTATVVEAAPPPVDLDDEFPEETDLPF